ncbi:MAG: hypothetical protein AB1941_07625 [Gemmatimonadota bacterium]
METTEIRAVEMVRRVRDQFYEETKEMSPKELKAFITQRADKVRSELGVASTPPRKQAGDSAA